MGHSTKECPFNMKTRGPQQVLLTQEASTLRGSRNTSNADATSGGYKNNRRGQHNNNANNNNGSRSQIQYDVNGWPMVQCRACNLWGHFARDCTTENAPKLLCKWCGFGDHEDAKCPKSGVNLITIGTDEEEVLAITRKQAKLYPDPTEEKKKLEEAWVKIEKATQAKKLQLKDTTGNSTRNCVEQNIIRKVMQMEVPIKLSDLLTMPQLGTTILNMTPFPKAMEETRRDGSGTTATNPMLLALTMGRHLVVMEMGILGTVLTDIIVDEGSGVNVLPEDVWKKLGQPTLWPPTFQLLMADQHRIKPLRTLRAQPVTIGTQAFLLDFVVIPLKRIGYDAILGRSWLVQANVKHDWKRNTLLMERGGRRLIIDLHTQMVGEEATSSDSEGEGGGDDEGKKRMELDEEGVLRLKGGLNEDDLDSVNGLFHWQIEDYELFSSCNMLGVEEEKGRNEFLKEYSELKEGEAQVDETLAHMFSENKPIKYEEAIVQTTNLRDDIEQKTY